MVGISELGDGQTKQTISNDIFSDNVTASTASTAGGTPAAEAGSASAEEGTEARTAGKQAAAARVEANNEREEPSSPCAPRSCQASQCKPKRRGRSMVDACQWQWARYE